MKLTKKQQLFINNYIDKIQIYPYMGQMGQIDQKAEFPFKKLPIKNIYDYGKAKYFIKIFQTDCMQIYINRLIKPVAYKKKSCSCK